MKKNKETRKKYIDAFKRHKMIPLFWSVLDDCGCYLIVKNRITGKFCCIGK